MEMLSKRYGWTPNQIREIPYDDIDAYLQIISIKNKHQHQQIKKNKR